MLATAKRQLRFSLIPKDLIILSRSHQNVKEKNQLIKLLFQKHQTQLVFRHHYNKKPCK